MIEQIRSHRLSGLGSDFSTHESVAKGAGASGNDFASLLAGFAKDSIGTMRQGEQAAVSGINGTAPIQEVVDKVMAAEQALQSALAVREKVVAAWLEVSRMTI
jgi:flagellar hook-basal body complex protein FliE